MIYAARLKRFQQFPFYTQLHRRHETISNRKSDENWCIEYIGDTPTADLVTLLGFIIGLTVIGVGLTKAFGLAQQDNTAIEMEVVVRNINLGLLLKVSLFPLVVGEVNALADMVLLSLLLYGAWQLIMGFALIFWRRNSTKRTTQTVTSA
mgnify:CR=1 FL=1